MLMCREFLEMATGHAPPPTRFSPRCGKEHVVNLLNEAAAQNISGLRVFGHTSMSVSFALVLLTFKYLTLVFRFAEEQASMKSELGIMLQSTQTCLYGSIREKSTMKRSFSTLIGCLSKQGNEGSGLYFRCLTIGIRLG